VAEEIRYRSADRQDLPGIAEVLLAAFPESVEHYVGRLVRPPVIEDVFRICLDAEPGALLVAAADARVLGYIFAPTELSHLFRVAVLRGHLLRMFWRWITGHYGIGLRPAAIAARNWLSIFRQTQEGPLESDARILSIAVHPDFQRRGIATHLTDLGLQYLREHGARTVRLEVRPDNLPARHIYEKFGFQEEGRTEDSQGEWLIMLKDLSERSGA